MRLVARVTVAVLAGLILGSTAHAGHELGVRAGGFDDFYLGAEWQTPARIGPSIFAPSADFTIGDLDAFLLNGDLRWDLLPIFDTGMVLYGKAGPTLLLGGDNTDLGLSLTIAAEIGLSRGRSLQLEWRFGLGDIPDSKIGLAVMFPL
jgi:hypothetical protein